MSYSIAGQDTELRAALVIEGESIAQHCERIRTLETTFQHGIRCLEQPMEGTCVTYALDLLVAHRAFVVELESFGVRAGCQFIEWMIEEEQLSELPEIQPGALVCYVSARSWPCSVEARNR